MAAGILPDSSRLMTGRTQPKQPSKPRHSSFGTRAGSQYCRVPKFLAQAQDSGVCGRSNVVSANSNSRRYVRIHSLSAVSIRSSISGRRRCTASTVFSPSSLAASRPLPFIAAICRNVKAMAMSALMDALWCAAVRRSRSSSFGSCFVS